MRCTWQPDRVVDLSEGLVNGAPAQALVPEDDLFRVSDVGNKAGELSRIVVVKRGHDRTRPVEKLIDLLGVEENCLPASCTLFITASILLACDDDYPCRLRSVHLLDQIRKQ